MATSLDELRRDVLVDCPKATDLVADGMIVDATIAFFKDSAIKNQTLSPISVVAATASYALANPTGYQILHPRWATLSNAPIAFVSEEQLDLEWAEKRAGTTYMTYHTHQYEGLTDTDWRVATADRPNLAFCPDPNTLRLVGIPTTSIADALLVNVVIYPVRTVTEIDDWIFNAYHPAIIAKALALMFSIPNRPWTNAPLSEANELEYQRLVESAQGVAQRNHRRNDAPLRVKSWAR